MRQSGNFICVKLKVCYDRKPYFLCMYTFFIFKQIYDILQARHINEQKFIQIYPITDGLIKIVF